MGLGLHGSIPMGVVMHSGGESGGGGDRSSVSLRNVGRRVAGCLLLGLVGLAGCVANDPVPGNASVANPDSIDDLRSAPCQVVTRDVVSDTFSVPVEEIEQSSMSSLCAYHWEREGELLDVTVHVSAIGADPAQATALFQQATTEPGQTPVMHSGDAFEDVDGLGDQARVDIRTGDVHVRRDRLYFTLNAYHGPVMPTVPRPPAVEGITDVREQWRRSTLADRRQAATDLVRASIDADEEH